MLTQESDITVNKFFMKNFLLTFTTNEERQIDCSAILSTQRMIQQMV